MLVSDYIIDFLASVGIKHIFGYQGGSVTHLIDSVARNPNINYIQNYHEQASALCADAYARVSNEGVGAAIASNGPGATNLITGIADAFCDSIPVIFITGQVCTYAMRKTEKIRQESFQEISITKIVNSITKYATIIMKPEDIAYELEKAFFLSTHGRPGPVLIDVPVDVQGMEVETDVIRHYKHIEDEGFNGAIDIKIGIVRTIECLKTAKRPVVLAGGGISGRETICIFRELISLLKIPTVVTLMGLDVLSHKDDFFYGFIGVYGNRFANLAVQNADVILVLGSRLDTRQTGKCYREFAKHARIVHIDIDKNEINHKVKSDISICCDLKAFMHCFIREIKNSVMFPDYQGWLKLLQTWKEKYSEQNLNGEGISPNWFIGQVGKLVEDNTIFTADVGQNQMWVAQSLRLNVNKFRILNSGGLGAMGFSLPAGIGAYFSGLFSKVICFTGDGGVQMNLQELCLIGSRKIPAKIILMNNFSLGLIRDIHQKYYGRRYIGSIEGFYQPQFKYIARAYNLGYFEVAKYEDIGRLSAIIKDDKPYIINCLLSQDTTVRPELLGKDRLDNQIPYLSIAEMENIKQELEGSFGGIYESQM